MALPFHDPQFHGPIRIDPKFAADQRAERDENLKRMSAKVKKMQRATARQFKARQCGQV